MRFNSYDLRLEFFLKGYIGNGMECKRKKDLSCSNDTSICDQNAECLSTGICQCKQGFEGDGYYCWLG